MKNWISVVIRNFRLKQSIFLIFLAVLLLTGIVPAEAREIDKSVVKIGFPVQSGMSYIDERGEYAGYLADYLHQLNLFANWEIEFVQVDGDLDTQLNTLIDMLDTGEIDMLGTMNRNAQLEELYLYPSYSYGTTYTTLAVPEDDLQWIEEDYSNWDHIRVGTCPEYEHRMEAFDNYARTNNFVYDVVEFGSYDEMVAAADTEQVDAILQVDLSLTDGLRIIGRFSPSPYYFAMSKDNTALMRQLDTAMRSLSSSQPNLQNELYDLHFRNRDEFLLSEAHREYLQSFGTLRVLFFSGNAPYQYIKDGELTGFAVEYWNNFAQAAGLQYETVTADSYEEAFDLVENGQVDIVVCVATNSNLAALSDVRFTLPYFNSFSVSACGNPEPHVHRTDLEFQMNTESALDIIMERQKPGVQLDYYAISFYLRKGAVYDGVDVDWTNTRNFSYVFGVTGRIPEDFVTILNQYISSVSAEDKQTMLYRYSGDSVEYTTAEWLQNHLLLIVSISGVILTVLFACGVVLRSRTLKYKALLAENRLTHMSMYDTITGAYNEIQFRKLLQERCEQKENLALVAFNIRGFKYINDTYGNKRGDELLCGIKNILEVSIQEGEFFCRPSADLFYMALQETEAAPLIERTNGIFEKIIDMVVMMMDGYPISLYSGAVFIGTSPAPYQLPSNMSYMMAALAYAKHENLHTTHIFDESLYQIEQLEYYIETHMERALKHEEYQLYLQPKMNLQTGQIDGAEALVRWQPPDREMIYPNQFIPLFEENGFCMRFDLYMVEQVCKTLRSWIDAGIKPIAISVNQSKALFIKEGYVESLLSITQRYHIPSRYIVLEILEGLAFENIKVLNSTIRQLNQAGFKVSMDDFGSGYSSLNTLGKVEINELKLDRAFLMDVVNDPRGVQREVLASILALAKKLGIQTVAEGVETKESEDMIRSMSCDYGQGYYYSKPIPKDEFRELFCTSESRSDT